MTSTPSTSRTASTISSTCLIEPAVKVMSRIIEPRAALTMSMAPISPPARPMAVVNSPNVPGRFVNFTRSVEV